MTIYADLHITSNTLQYVQVHDIICKREQHYTITIHRISVYGNRYDERTITIMDKTTIEAHTLIQYILRRTKIRYTTHTTLIVLY